MNIRGYDEFALYEIGKVHSKKAVDEAGLPSEIRRVGYVYASKKSREGAAYYKAKATLEFLAHELGLSLEYKSLPNETSLTVLRPFAVSRSARIIDANSEQVIGVIGEFAPEVTQSFKLPEYTAGFELMPEAIELARAKRVSAYRPLSRFPSVAQDISLRVDTDVAYSEVLSVVEDTARQQSLDVSVQPLSIYQAESETQKTITFHVVVTSYDRTLKESDASQILDAIAKATSEKLAAVIV